jgi:hypothetical protein
MSKPRKSALGVLLEAALLRNAPPARPGAVNRERVRQTKAEVAASSWLCSSVDKPCPPGAGPRPGATPGGSAVPQEAVAAVGLGPAGPADEEGDPGPVGPGELGGVGTGKPPRRRCRRSATVWTGSGAGDTVPTTTARRLHPVQKNTLTVCSAFALVGRAQLLWARGVPGGAETNFPKLLVHQGWRRPLGGRCGDWGDSVRLRNAAVTPGLSVQLAKLGWPSQLADSAS